jgi:hypothetical protein
MQTEKEERDAGPARLGSSAFELGIGFEQGRWFYLSGLFMAKAVA